MYLALRPLSSFPVGKKSTPRKEGVVQGTFLLLFMLTSYFAHIEPLLSWSPRGVLLNTVSGAQWLHSNKTDGIQPGGDIICKPYQFDGRDSEVKELFFPSIDS